MTTSSMYVNQLIYIDEMVILEVLLVVRWGLRMVLVGGRILTRRLMLLLGRISKVTVVGIDGVGTYPGSTGPLRGLPRDRKKPCR